MAKKQTRRSISVSRTTYERLKAFCETNNVSMSQLVETRVNDFLGTGGAAVIAAFQDGAPAAAPVRPMAQMGAMGAMGPIGGAMGAMAPRAAATPVHTMSPSSSSAPVTATARPVEARPVSPGMPAGTPGVAAAAPVAASQPAPMTSAAARFAVEPPLPIIKPRQDTAAPKPAEKRPEQIFTF